MIKLVKFKRPLFQLDNYGSRKSSYYILLVDCLQLYYPWSETLYLRIHGHVVWMAFRYCFWYKNNSIIKSRPFWWLKKTYKDQWINHVLCCKVWRDVPKDDSSMYCWSFFKSSKALSHSCIKFCNYCTWVRGAGTYLNIVWTNQVVLNLVWTKFKNRKFSWFYTQK